MVDNITLPTWTNVAAPAVQDAAEGRVEPVCTAVAAHEDLHAADDKSTYDPVGATLGQKKIGAAIDAVSAATTAANAKAAPRDAVRQPTSHAQPGRYHQGPLTAGEVGPRATRRCSPARRLFRSRRQN